MEEASGGIEEAASRLPVSGSSGAEPAAKKARLSVLGQMREAEAEQRARRLQTLLQEADRMPFWLRAGVPLGPTQMELLRFAPWKRRDSDLGNAALVAYSPAGDTLAVLTTRHLRLAGSGVLCNVDLTLPFQPSVLKWTREDEIIASSGSQRTAMILAIHESALVPRMFNCGQMTTLQDVAAGRNPSSMLFAGGRDGNLYGWDRRAGSGPRGVGTTRRRTAGALNCVEVSPDGQVLISASQSGLVELWDARQMSKTPLWSASSSKLCFGQNPSGDWNADAIMAMKLDHDTNSILAVQKSNGDCGILDLVSLTGRSLYTPSTRRAAAADAPLRPRGECSLSFLPGTPWLAAASNFSVKMLNVKSKSVCNVAVGSAANSVSCHPQGNALAYALVDGSLGIFGMRGLPGANENDEDEGEEGNGIGQHEQEATQTANDGRDQVEEQPFEDVEDADQERILDLVSD